MGIDLIVAELVINAFKHAPFDATAGGEIIVAYDVAGPDWRRTVSFNRPMSRLEGTQKKPVPGLGTSIIKALAKQLEPHVKVSKSPRHHGVDPSAVSIPPASASSAPGSSTYA